MQIVNHPYLSTCVDSAVVSSAVLCISSNSQMTPLPLSDRHREWLGTQGITEEELDDMSENLRQLLTVKLWSN